MKAAGNGIPQLDLGAIQSVTGAVYEALKDAIVFGDLTEGQRLSERRLAQQLGVSTTPIKRAFHMLKMEGLIEVRPRSGTFVGNLGITRLHENTLVRANLESLAARFAAEKATDDDISKLRLVFDEAQDAVASRDRERMVEANTKFHVTIDSIARNPYLIQLIQTLRGFDRRLRTRALMDPQEAARGFQEHRRILEAIETRDPDLAAKRIEEHILRTSNVVEQDISAHRL